MAWKVTDLMDQKIRFVVRAVGAGVNMNCLCCEFGISWLTGYYWLGRYRDASSITGLQEHSQRLHQSPRRTEVSVEARLMELKQQHGLGGKKLPSPGPFPHPSLLSGLESRAQTARAAVGWIAGVKGERINPSLGRYAVLDAARFFDLLQLV